VPYLLCAGQESGGSQRLDLGRQTALGARGLVLVDDLLVGDAVEDGNGLLEDALSGGLAPASIAWRTRFIAVRSWLGSYSSGQSLIVPFRDRSFLGVVLEEYRLPAHTTLKGHCEASSRRFPNQP